MDLLNQIREIREQFDIHQRKRNKSGLNSINESVLSIQDSSGMVDLLMPLHGYEKIKAIDQKMYNQRQGL